MAVFDVVINFVHRKHAKSTSHLKLSLPVNCALKIL